MRMKCVIIASASVLLLVVASIGGQEPKKKAEGDAGKDMAKILANKKLWGKDFPRALATLPQWQVARERQVEVLHSEIVSKTAADTTNHAAMVASINAVPKEARAVPRPAFAAMLKDAVPAGQPALKAQIVEKFKDDQKPRTVMTAPGAQFLAPGLDVATVMEELGAPTKKDLRVIQTDGDRRPITLTEYSYANGSVVFATSDLDPEPEDGDPNKKPVNRAILSVPQANAEVFETIR